MKKPIHWGFGFFWGADFAVSIMTGSVALIALAVILGGFSLFLTFSDERW